MAAESLRTDRVEDLLSTVARAFESAGWRSQTADLSAASAGGVPRADLLLSEPAGHLHYVVQLKVLGANRRELLKSLLAAAAVEARAHAKAIAGARPLALVGTPFISPPIAEELKRYAQRYLPGVAIGWVDARGGLFLNGTRLEGIGTPVLRSVTTRGRPRPRTGPFPLFSDLNQWMLKVLLAHRIGGDNISLPRERPQHASHLALLAEVSVPTASRLVANLKERSMLESGPQGLQLVQVPELLELWRRHVSLQIDEEAMCWILPGRETSQARLMRALKDFTSTSRNGNELQRPRACLGLFAACDVLGFSRVRGVPPHLYLEFSNEKVLRQLGLRHCRQGEPAEVFVRPALSPEAIFRASVTRGGVPVSDALQCWLDVSDHPSRGEEQRRALEAQLLGRLLQEDSEEA